jgi:phytoene dehydrogenase-like protein
MAGYDVVVVGGGHNGLTCAAYLARAGARVLVLERRGILGGCGTSEAMIPDLPEFTFNPGAVELLGFTGQPVFRDFALDRHGLELIPNDPFYFMPFPDGRAVFFHRDVEVTAESIRAVSPADAEAYVRFVRFWSELDELVGPFYTREAPLPGRRPGYRRRLPRGRRSIGPLVRRSTQAVSVGAKIARSKAVAEMLRVAMMPARRYLAEVFESREMQAVAAFFAMQTKGTLDDPGSALGMVELPWSHAGGVHRPRGGMGKVSEAIARAFESHGGEIRRDAHVAEILVERGRAIGVRLAGGEEIRARRAVVAAISPLRTLLVLVAERHLDPRFRRRVECIANDNTNVLKGYYALEEAPVFSASGDDGSEPKWRTAAGMLSGVEAADAMWADVKAGRLPRAVGWCWCTFTSVLDPTLAPPGKHTLGLHMWVPYRLAEGRDWDDAKEEMAMRLFDEYCRYAPNLKGKLAGWAARSPKDWEAVTDNPHGNMFHVDYVPHQTFGLRPLPELSDYRTPIEGLYLSGAGTHPGPAITGLPGHNAARAVLEDVDVS